MNSFSCSRRELILFYIENDKTVSALSTFLRENHHVSSENIDFIVCDIQKKLLPQFNTRWAQASRNKDNFLKKNSSWLDMEYSVSITEDESSPCTSSTTDKRGRPCVPYEDSSESSKRRKNTSLLREYGFEHIFEAYLQGLRSRGEGIEANLVEFISTADAEKRRQFPTCLAQVSFKHYPKKKLWVFILTWTLPKHSIYT